MNKEESAINFIKSLDKHIPYVVPGSNTIYFSYYPDIYEDLYVDEHETIELFGKYFIKIMYLSSLLEVELWSKSDLISIKYFIKDFNMKNVSFDNILSNYKDSFDMNSKYFPKEMDEFAREKYRSYVKDVVLKDIDLEFL